MIRENPRNDATFGIISPRYKSAGAQFAAASGVAIRRWRSLAMGSYTQLSFTEQVKRCRECGEVKPGTEFHVARHTRDGLNSYCKACACLRTQRWYRANPDRARETSRQYEQRNREQVRAAHRAWFAKNRERLREKRHSYVDANRERLDEYFAEYRKRRAQHIRDKAKAWYRDNTARAKDSQYRRRARVRAEATPETVAYMQLIAGDPCSYCGGVADTVEHIVPLSRGGKHEVDNLAAACRLCNQRKQTNSLLRFLHRTGLCASALAQGES